LAKIGVLCKGAQRTLMQSKNMLKVISSKNESLVYNEIGKVKKKLGFAVGTQNIFLLEAIGRVGDISIFGEKEVFLVNFKAGDMEVLQEDKTNLKVFAESENLYFFVGSGVEFEKYFAGQKQEVVKLEEKKVFDFPADLVNAMQRGDKKNGWNLLVKELQTKDAEPVHGSCVFAYKSLLVFLNDIKKNSPGSGVKDFSWNGAKRNAVAGKRERDSVVDKYFELVVNYHKAREGKGDLAKQLELWVLK